MERLDSAVLRVTGLPPAASFGATMRQLSFALHSQPPAAFVRALAAYLRVSLRAPSRVVQLAAVAAQLRRLQFVPILEKVLAELLFEHIHSTITR